MPVQSTKFKIRKGQSLLGISLRHGFHMSSSHAATRFVLNDPIVRRFRREGRKKKSKNTYVKVRRRSCLKQRPVKQRDTWQHSFRMGVQASSSQGKAMSHARETCFWLSRTRIGLKAWGQAQREFQDPLPSPLPGACGAGRLPRGRSEYSRDPSRPWRVPDFAKCCANRLQPASLQEERHAALKTGAPPPPRMDIQVQEYPQ